MPSNKKSGSFNKQREIEKIQQTYEKDDINEIYQEYKK